MGATEVAAAQLRRETAARLRAGLAIPAHPLALDAERRFDETAQRALTRYYLAAGAGGLAVAVHTTQFALRRHGLLRPVLELAAETARAHGAVAPPVMIAGVCGDTTTAVAEAALARDLGYDLALLGMQELGDAPQDVLLAHAAAVGEVLPLCGFYLQPAVGGRDLDRAFWRAFAALPAVVAVKLAPFDRYRTLAAVHGIAESGRAAEIALYTGNDDHIVHDLLARYRTVVGGGVVEQRFAGGLLGHWAVWTERAAALRARLAAHARQPDAGMDVARLAVEVTDCNAALFDAANGFDGCIAGLHYVLHGQGLLTAPHTLDPAEGLSPGQAAEIERVRRDHPHLVDDAFVAAHRDEWLR